MSHLRWILSAAIAAWAASLAVHHATPIDRALPFISVIATVLAAASHSAVMLAVPLLVAVEIAVPDEQTRLLSFGVILALAFFAAIAGSRQPGVNEPPPSEWGERRRNRRLRRESAIAIALCALLVLRWIPVESVRFGRELLLLAVAAMIVPLLGASRISIAVAVAVAFLPPAIPLRSLLFPLVAAMLVLVGRLFARPRFDLRWLPALAVAIPMLFFAWSGVAARALPYLLRRTASGAPRHTVNQALPPGKELALDVPAGAQALILSGANVARAKKGTRLGHIEPGSIDVRIGDVADWGYMRREQAHASRNVLPADPAGRIRGYGYEAWVDGAGRVALPPGARRLTIVADHSLPAGASLQVEAFELRP